MPGAFATDMAGGLGRGVRRQDRRPAPRRAARAARRARRHGRPPRRRRVPATPPGRSSRSTAAGRRSTDRSEDEQRIQVSELFDLQRPGRRRDRRLVRAGRGVRAHPGRRPAPPSCAAARRLDRLEVLARSSTVPHRDGRPGRLRRDLRATTGARLVETALRRSPAASTCSSTTPACPGPPDAEDETVDGFAALLDLNLAAGFHLAVAGRLDRRRRTPALSIVNISSVIGLVSTAPIGGASYAASKAGSHRADPRARRPVGSPRHPRQRHRPGLVRHRDDRRPVHQRQVGRLGAAQHDARPRRARRARSTAPCCSSPPPRRAT